MSGQSAGQGRGVAYVEGMHTLAVRTEWGTLYPLGKGRHVVTCGRCKVQAEGFTVSSRPGEYVKDRGWRIWRMCGWVCPACEAAWHGETATGDAAPQKVTLGWLTWHRTDGEPAPAAVQVMFAPRPGLGTVQVGTWDPRLRVWTTVSQTWRPENVTHWAEMPPLPKQER